MHVWKNSAIEKFQNLFGKAISVCPGKAFTIYLPNYTQICRRNRIMPVPVEVQVASFLHFICVERCCNKTANAFGISRTSASAIIRRVSYAITNFLGPAQTHKISNY